MLIPWTLDPAKGKGYVRGSKPITSVSHAQIKGPQIIWKNWACNWGVLSLGRIKDWATTRNLKVYVYVCTYICIHAFVYEYMYTYYIYVCVYRFNSIKSLSSNCSTCARHSEEDIRFLWHIFRHHETLERILIFEVKSSGWKTVSWRVGE